jgi:CheY-like chemotaxis protein
MRASTADLLVVEDDRDAAEALAEVLRDAGHRVRLALDGEEGLGLLEEVPPDVVLLDVEMPVLTGPEMAASMRAPRVQRFRAYPSSSSPALVSLRG